MGEMRKYLPSKVHMTYLKADNCSGTPVSFMTFNTK